MASRHSNLAYLSPHPDAAGAPLEDVTRILLASARRDEPSPEERERVWLRLVRELGIGKAPPR